jgi:hypothetical protein
VNDLPETLVVGTGDWTAAGLTLKLGNDGKLHVYRTGTTEDAVPPHATANVLGIDVTGSGTSDVLIFDSQAVDVPQLAITKATAQAASLNSTTITVLSGTLTAGSIVCDTLFIGASPTAAASAKAPAAASAPTATVAKAAAAVPAVVEAQPLAAKAVAVAAIPAVPTLPEVPAVAAVPQVFTTVSVSSAPWFKQAEPQSGDSLLAQSPLGDSLYAAAGLERQLAGVRSSFTAERLHDTAVSALTETVAESKKPSPAAVPVDSTALSAALQSVLREYRPAGAQDEADAAFPGLKRLRKQDKLAKKAVDAIHSQLIARD